MKDEIKKQIELFLETQLSGGNFDLIMERVKEELKKTIHGKIDDVILDAVMPKLLPILKDALLKEVEKISDKV
jgi:hypothetical protein